MRLLFLTNFYPPYSRGGYEQWCQEVAETLRQGGHDVLVLTGRQRQAVQDPAWIQRRLHLEMELASLRNGLRFFVGREAREQENLSFLRHTIEAHKPDAVLVWGMWNLQRSLPSLAETLLPGRVVYYIGDYWPTLPSQHTFYWQASARNWLTAIPKSILAMPARWMLAREERPTLQFPHTLFCSAFLRDDLQKQGISGQHTRVIYGAIDTRLYANGQNNFRSEPADERPYRLLYAGRLRQDKGVHTAVAALGNLVHRQGVTNVEMQIVGTGDPAYVASLHQMAAQHQVGSHVTFLGARPKEEMPALYRCADVFLFTSLWQEPFGRVLVEAMASGVPIVGSCTGGASEILVEGQNALTFTPGDVAEMAAQIVRLYRSPDLHQQLAENGRRMAVEKFDVKRMAEEIEAYLMEIV